MTSYNIKCKGCGVYLNDDINSAGYVPKFIQKKTIYCQRCFRFINYGCYEVNINDQQQIKKQLDELITTRHMIYLVIDPFDIYNTLITHFIKHKYLIIIVNKMDLFKPYKNNKKIEQAIINNILNTGFLPQQIFFTSVKNKTGFNTLLNHIKQTQSSNYKNIFVGLSNVGKSSLINKLISINDKHKPQHTISCYLNTTRDVIKTTVNKLTIIDTPGYINDKSILNNIDLVDTKKVITNKISKIRNYQIRHNKTISIENLISFDIAIKKNKLGRINFLINDNLSINSFKNYKGDVFNQPNQIKNKVLQPKQITIKFNKPIVNLVISSLGIISCHQIESMTINYYGNIGIYELIEPIVS